MKYRMYTLSAFIKSMREQKLDLSEFVFSYNKINFDVIMDISTIPFQMLLGAQSINFAIVLNVEQGFSIDFPDEAFYELCNKLHLIPGKETFTSFLFLSYISRRVPTTSNTSVVQPSHILPFRKHLINKNDEADKTVFIGWNDHKRDKRKARNFDKTELFFGKQVADFCRKNNISSIWGIAAKEKEIDATYPPNYKKY